MLGANFKYKHMIPMLSSSRPQFPESSLETPETWAPIWRPKRRQGTTVCLLRLWFPTEARVKSNLLIEKVFCRVLLLWCVYKP